jgi:type II secretory pathway pseudopilin PulG
MTPLAITTFEIVLLVVIVLIAVMVTGGYIASNRRAAARERKLLDQLQTADSALAQAHAEDKGWDRALLEAAARDAVTERFAGAQVRAMHLVQVVDRPGIEEDEAVFRVVTDGGEQDVRLGRREDGWAPIR